MIIRKVSAALGSLKNCEAVLHSRISAVNADSPEHANEFCAGVKGLLFGGEKGTKAGMQYFGSMDVVAKKEKVTLSRDNRGMASMKSFSAAYTETGEPVSGITEELAGEQLSGVSGETFEKYASLDLTAPAGSTADFKADVEELLAMCDECLEKEDLDRNQRAWLRPRIDDSATEIASLRKELVNIRGELAKLVDAYETVDSSAKELAELGNDLFSEEKYVSEELQKAKEIISTYADGVSDEAVAGLRAAYYSLCSIRSKIEHRRDIVHRETLKHDELLDGMDDSPFFKYSGGDAMELIIQLQRAEERAELNKKRNRYISFGSWAIMLLAIYFAAPRTLYYWKFLCVIAGMAFLVFLVVNLVTWSRKAQVKKLLKIGLFNNEGEFTDEVYKYATFSVNERESASRLAEAKESLAAAEREYEQAKSEFMMLARGVLPVSDTESLPLALGLLDAAYAAEKSITKTNGKLEDAAAAELQLKRIYSRCKLKLGELDLTGRPAAMENAREKLKEEIRSEVAESQPSYVMTAAMIAAGYNKLMFRLAELDRFACDLADRLTCASNELTSLPSPVKSASGNVYELCKESLNQLKLMLFLARCDAMLDWSITCPILLRLNKENVGERFEKCLAETLKTIGRSRQVILVTSGEGGTPKGIRVRNI